MPARYEPRNMQNQHPTNLGRVAADRIIYMPPVAEHIDAPAAAATANPAVAARYSHASTHISTTVGHHAQLHDIQASRSLGEAEVGEPLAVHHGKGERGTSSSLLATQPGGIYNVSRRLTTAPEARTRTTLSGMRQARKTPKICLYIGTLRTDVKKIILALPLLALPRRRKLRYYS